MSVEDYQKFDTQINNLHRELQSLINQLNVETIPSREELIKADYVKKLEEFGIIKTRKKGMQSAVLDEKSQSNKSIQEFIQSLLAQITGNKKENLKIIREIFSHLEGIEDEDKEVLISTLSEANSDTIKKSILDIISAFNGKKK